MSEENSTINLEDLVKKITKYKKQNETRLDAYIKNNREELQEEASEDEEERTQQDEWKRAWILETSFN